MNGCRDSANGAEVSGEIVRIPADDVVEEIALHPLQHADVPLAALERKCDVVGALAGSCGYRHVYTGLEQCIRPHMLGFKLGERVVSRAMDPEHVPLVRRVDTE